VFQKCSKQSKTSLLHRVRETVSKGPKYFLPLSWLELGLCNSHLWLRTLPTARGPCSTRLTVPAREGQRTPIAPARRTARCPTASWYPSWTATDLAVPQAYTALVVVNTIQSLTASSYKWRCSESLPGPTPVLADGKLNICPYTLAVTKAACTLGYTCSIRESGYIPLPGTHQSVTTILCLVWGHVTQERAESKMSRRSLRWWQSCSTQPRWEAKAACPFWWGNLTAVFHHWRVAA